MRNVIYASRPTRCDPGRTTFGYGPADRAPGRDAAASGGLAVTAGDRRDPGGRQHGRIPSPRGGVRRRATECLRVRPVAGRAGAAAGPRRVPVCGVPHRAGGHGGVFGRRFRSRTGIPVAGRGVPDGGVASSALAHLSPAGAGLDCGGVAVAADPRGTAAAGGRHRRDRRVAAGPGGRRRGHSAAAVGAGGPPPAADRRRARGARRTGPTGRGCPAVAGPRAARRARPRLVDDQRAVIGGSS